MIGDPITQGEAILNKMKAKNPLVKDLVERFDLEVINISKLTKPSDPKLQ